MNSRIPFYMMVILVVVGGYSILAFGVHKATVAADQAHDTICALRGGFMEDLAIARKSQLNILKLAREHPNGVNLGDLHYTKSQIEQAVQDQNFRVSSLEKRVHSSDDAGCTSGDLK